MVMFVLSLGHPEIWFMFFSPQIYCPLGLPRIDLIVFQFNMLLARGSPTCGFSGLLGIDQIGPQLVVQAFCLRLGLHKDILLCQGLKGNNNVAAPWVNDIY